MTTNEEARDQWGETAEERHSRILTRDLAWLTYSDQCARDRTPAEGRDHIAFNAGWAHAYANITAPAAPDHQAEAPSDEVAKAIRGLDYWAKNADNPAIRVDCAYARDLLAARPVVDDAAVERARHELTCRINNKIQVTSGTMRAVLLAALGGDQ